MGSYGQMAHQARQRKKSLEKRLATAERDVRACVSELSVLDQILDALKGGSRRGGGAAGKRGGKWRPGRPGRPPNWYIEQQKGKKKRGRRGRRRRRAAAAAPAAG